MNPNTRTIDDAAFATAALALMEERKITIYDLWTLELI